MTHPFDSPHLLEQQFTEGLDAMLARHPGLGVYILVLANAAYDPALWAHLSPALAARHAQLADTLTRALRCGAALAEPEDDVMVFLKLHTIGFDQMGRRESRQDGPWLANYNPLRALRPPRSSRETFGGLLRPFDPAGFHFNRVFLAKEILWQGELCAEPVRLLYNKFPFARLHSLLVPQPAQELPQHLTAAWHAWAWAVCSRLGHAGQSLAYNSLGAGASVNHLHFQSFVQPPALPVLDAGFAHNGGQHAYPLPVTRFTDPDAAWAHIAGLHARAQPYNLIYTHGTVTCIARVPQDSAHLTEACRSYGWSEMAGAVTLFNRDDYANWRGAQLAEQLAGFAPPTDR